MGQVHECIDGRLRAFVEAQKMFFVASAPLAGDARINVSPKGRDGSLTVLDERTVAYLDFGGSHAETIAHLRENGRITLMWCAFDGPPKIDRRAARAPPPPAAPAPPGALTATTRQLHPGQRPGFGPAGPGTGGGSRRRGGSTGPEP
nr:pyridoxamine 5'-phosphate oxidase family protein [Parafrankia elaeagni]